MARVVDRLRGEADDLGWEAVEERKERGERAKMVNARKAPLVTPEKGGDQDDDGLDDKLSRVLGGAGMDDLNT